MRSRSPLTPLLQTVVVAGLVVAAAALSWFASSWLSTDNLALIFLVAVTVTGGYIGLRAAIAASVLSFLAYNFLFTEPRFTLLVARTDDVVSLVAFLLASFVVGELAGRFREQAEDARRSADRVSKLLEFSGRLASAGTEEQLREAAGTGIREVLGGTSVVLAADVDGAPRYEAATPQELTEETEASAARWAMANETATGRGTRTLPDARWRFEPVTAGDTVLGLVGVQPDTMGQAFDAESERLLSALRVQLALAWERLRLQRQATDERVDEIADQLRSALLLSVSHDLRTPLVSIIGALTALHDLEGKLSAEDRADLSLTALQEARRLNRFVQNLLDMTRLSYGALQPRQEAVSVAEAVEEARRRLDAQVAARGLRVSIDPPQLLVRADRTLLEQVLVNLLENAAKYSPAAEPITISAQCRDGQVLICVADRGPGIAAEDRERVFDLFYRARQRDTTAAGQGLGLPICRGFVEAMGGRVALRPGPEGRGTTMEVTLPALAVPGAGGGAAR